MYHSLHFWLQKYREFENILHVYIFSLSSDDFERDWVSVVLKNAILLW